MVMYHRRIKQAEKDYSFEDINKYIIFISESREMEEEGIVGGQIAGTLTNVQVLRIKIEEIQTLILRMQNKIRKGCRKLRRKNKDINKPFKVHLS